MTECEHRQLKAIRDELGRAHAEQTAPVVNALTQPEPDLNRSFGRATGCVPGVV